ncbi:MAG: hypothetical protein FK734_19245 [Asgard group archaeon]|nr:hypothetical protein [Asgard group archaeon]
MIKSTIKRTKFLIKTSDYWKRKLIKFRISLYVILIIVAFVCSMVTGNFNAYFYFLDIFKVVIFCALLWASAYFIVADKETFENWNNPSFRKKDLLGKLVLAAFEGIIFLLISTIIFAIFRFSGFPYQYVTEHFPGGATASPLRYTPSVIDGILIAGIIILQIITIFSSIYWYYARCWKIIGFNEEKKIIKISLRFLIGLIINISFWMFSTVILDQVYFNFIYPEAYPNFHLLENSIFATKPYLFLILQLVSIILLNIFYVIDGIVANKRRTNFIEIDPIESIINE